MFQIITLSFFFFFSSTRGIGNLNLRSPSPEFKFVLTDVGNHISHNHLHAYSKWKIEHS